MSRNSRNYGPIHKFIWKPASPEIFLINPVEWLPRKEVSWPSVKQPGRASYEIFAQREITIQPTETAAVETGLGVRMMKGWCGLTLGQEILASGCSLQGDGVVAENVADIVITIVNDSASVVVIAAGDLLCIVYHTQRVRPA